MQRGLALVIFDQFGLWVLPSTHSEHIDDNFNDAEGLSLKQSFRTKIQLSEIPNSKSQITTYKISWLCDVEFLVSYSE